LLIATIQRRIELDKRVLSPDTAAQVLPHHQFAGAAQEMRKDLSRLTLQRDFSAVAAQFAGSEVELELAERHQSLSAHRLATHLTGVRQSTPGKTAPQSRAAAGHTG
jgi:hypothetical protein